MINRKTCICYLCRKPIEVGQSKTKFRSNSFRHSTCERKPRKRSLKQLLSQIWEGLK